jgi:hypothetical protein
MLTEDIVCVVTMDGVPTEAGATAGAAETADVAVDVDDDEPQP